MKTVQMTLDDEDVPERLLRKAVNQEQLKLGKKIAEEVEKGLQEAEKLLETEKRAER